jgi:deoxyribose-phosphate aldolase
MKEDNIMKNLGALIEEEIKRVEAADKDSAKEYEAKLPLGKYCDHTVLRAYTPKSIVKRFCDEAKANGAASICVNPVHVKLVSEELKGTDIRTCCVIGFPLGANTPSIKAAEAREALENGAQEVDMVINVGALRDSDFELVYEDIKGVVDVAKGKAQVKVIIETCYLSKNQKVAACVIAKEAGADFVKTSSGMGTGGATVEDVQLMKLVVGDSMRIKASAGIETKEDVITMVKAGAERVGTSRIVQIVRGDPKAFSASKDNQPPKYM